MGWPFRLGSGRTLQVSKQQAAESSHIHSQAAYHSPHHSVPSSLSGWDPTYVPIEERLGAMSTEEKEKLDAAIAADDARAKAAEEREEKMKAALAAEKEAVAIT